MKFLNKIKFLISSKFILTQFLSNDKKLYFQLYQLKISLKIKIQKIFFNLVNLTNYFNKIF